MEELKASRKKTTLFSSNNPSEYKFDDENEDESKDQVEQDDDDDEDEFVGPSVDFQQDNYESPDVTIINLAKIF